MPDNLRTIDDMLAGGPPVISWKKREIGYTVKGTLTAPPSVQQDVDFETREPKTWKDGRPVEVVVITLQTEERDPSNPDDDGERRIFAKFKLWQAIASAVKTAGGEFTTGGKLAVRFDGEGEPTKPGFNGPNRFTAQYEAPPSRVDALVGNTVQGVAEGTATSDDLF